MERRGFLGALATFGLLESLWSRELLAAQGWRCSGRGFASWPRGRASCGGSRCATWNFSGDWRSCWGGSI